MEKHTPGPWNFHAQGNANEYCLLTNEKRWVIGFLQNGEIMTSEQIANAHLIAAAPEILEALETAAEIIVQIEEESNYKGGALRARLMEVISKAKGKDK